MKYYRTLAVAAVFAGGLALPALAQTATPDPVPAPKADTTAPLPDVGVKKGSPSLVKHARHTHKPAKSAPAPTRART